MGWFLIVYLPFLKKRLSRPKSDISDEELISRIQQDNQDAWATFLNRYTDLIYSKAREFSTIPDRGTVEDLDDEAADLYLFIASYLKQSLKTFRRECKPKTWVVTIISNRARILSAYLYQKDPGRANIRLPRILESHPKIDHEIFRRLIWGLIPAYIARELNLPEHQCHEVEDLIAQNSPRVYKRMLANRTARTPKISIDVQNDDLDDKRGPQIQIADTHPDPSQNLEMKEATTILHDAVLRSLHALSVEERRILILLYNHGATPSEIAQMAGKDLGLSRDLNMNPVISG